MSDAVALREDLVSALRLARREARADDLVSATIALWQCDATAAFRAVRAAGHNAALWLRPADGMARLAAGDAATLTASGADRIVALRRGWSDLRAGAAGATGLRAFVGFSFDERIVPAPGPVWTDFPRALLVVPRLLVEWKDGRAVARAAARADDASADEDLARIGATLAAASSSADPEPSRAERTGELPARDVWRAQVARARDEIRRGELEKIVLARAVRLRVRADAAEATLAILARRSPGCTVYAVARGHSLLLGATPESLVSLDSGTARVSCVAGTAPRVDEDHDAAAALALVRSEKDQREHELVARAARAALESCCDAVRASGPPRLMALATLWHLASEVRGTARPGIELLDLAAALHPTPAVCGAPRAAAMRALAEREPFDRGWYGGALGWIDERGDGELVVALRGALARAHEAWLFAGCGIVAGSDPDAELAESDAKLVPMLDALGAR
ncbi:MAG TPA: isochorismate synthase [Candidatus Limnocylindria bacterium]|nr:isochorismate synthase [Candidatus Limnocylindria bacterium]